MIHVFLSNHLNFLVESVYDTNTLFQDLGGPTLFQANHTAEAMLAYLAMI